MQEWLEVLANYNGSTPFSDIDWLDQDIPYLSQLTVQVPWVVVSYLVVIGLTSVASALIARNKKRHNLNMYLECIPGAIAILAILSWGHSLKSKRLILKLDNETVVQIKTASKSKRGHVSGQAHADQNYAS